MQRRQAFQFQLMPNGAQQRLMRRFAGACRFVFNKALALQQANHEAGGKFIGYVAMAKQLTDWRHDEGLSWLKEAPCHPLQHALKDLDRAFQNFFAKRARYPRFKCRGQRDAFRYPDPKQVRLDQGNARIFLPKLGWLRYRRSRDVAGALRNATVSLRGGKWFVAIQTQQDIPAPVPTATTAIGIDVGIARFATCSDGNYLRAINSFKQHQQRLARYQRRMSRKVKFSKNWQKARAQVQRVHSTIANVRKNFLHQASAAICRNHALVCIEDLKVAQMSRSAKGSAEQAGRQVRQKSGLNCSILDQGWSEFRRQLEYKLAWAGGTLVAVPPHHTSQTCPACAHMAPDNRKSQATFCCVKCGYANHADVVGAINILERGLRLLACGAAAQPGRAMKQEPSEARGLLV